MGDWVSAVTPYASATGATATFNRPVATYAVDDAIVFDLREQGTVSGTTPISLPAGVIRPGAANGAADRAQGIFLYRVTDKDNVPATFVFGGFTSGRGVGLAQVRRGLDWANLVAGAPAYSSTELAALTAAGVPLLYLVNFGDERVSPRSHVPSVKPSGFTERANLQSTLDSSTTGSRTAIWAGEKVVPAGGSTSLGAVALTWPDGVSANKATGIVLRELAPATDPVGLKLKMGDGVDGFMRFGDGVPAASVNIWIPGHNDVQAFINGQGNTAAHRGLSLDNPEFSEWAYDHAVYKSFDPLEMSVAFSADNVPFGCAEATLDRIAGVTGNVDPTTLPWATIRDTYRNVLRPIASGVTQPLYRLEEFLTKYKKNHTMLVDPKFGWSTPSRVAAMLDMCKNIAGVDKVIIKYDFPVTDPQLVNAAKAAGFKTMNYWGTNQAALTPAYHTDKWDLIGVAYNADQAMYDAALAIGKKVWAAVIPDQAGYNTAMSRGANLAMASSAAITAVPAR